MSESTAVLATVLEFLDSDEEIETAILRHFSRNKKRKRSSIDSYLTKVALTYTPDGKEIMLCAHVLYNTFNAQILKATFA